MAQLVYPRPLASVLIMDVDRGCGRQLLQSLSRTASWKCQFASERFGWLTLKCCLSNWPRTGPTVAQVNAGKQTDNLDPKSPLKATRNNNHDDDKRVWPNFTSIGSTWAATAKRIWNSWPREVELMAKVCLLKVGPEHRECISADWKNECLR